VREADHSPPI